MSKPVVYITRKIPEALLEPYKEELQFNMWSSEQTPVPEEVLYEEIKQAQAMLCLLTEKINNQFLTYASHLKIIANMAVGFDNIDVVGARKQGIIVTNTPDVLTETTADLTFTLLCTTARRIIEANHTIQEDEWGDWSPFMLAGSDIYAKKIGIIGMGRIGEAVARRAKGFNMDILYHNRRQNVKLEEELDATYLSFHDLLNEADFIVSLVPLTNETADMFNEDTFRQMKSSAIFINVSRGGVVDEDALYHALKNGVIKAAGLDVFKKEPIDSTHPLASLPNAVLLPHIGSATINTRNKMIQLCLDNIHAVLKGNRPITQVNK
ncbi:MAG TPA: D-glycerate dehydrogenase [Staphylococcus sp.]|nr:D-glycerate dehydrogenase [Staphylococcus sp.]